MFFKKKILFGVLWMFIAEKAVVLDYHKVMVPHEMRTGLGCWSGTVTQHVLTDAVISGLQKVLSSIR